MATENKTSATNDAKKKAKELIEWAMNEYAATIIVSNMLLQKHRLKKAKKLALKIAKSEWEVLEQARVFEQHDFYLELFKEIENYE